MKSHFTTIIFLSLITLLISCSSSNVILQPKYTERNIDKGSIAVLILDENPEINYEGNLKPEFGEGNPQKLIMDFFIRQIPADIKEITKLEQVEVVSENPEQGIGYTTREVEVWKNGFLFKIKQKFNVRVPSKGSKYSFSGFEPTYTLLINELKIETSFHYTAPSMGANGVMMGGSSSKKLNYISDFCLWDNEKNDLISYGHIERTAQNPFNVVTMTTWTDVSHSYVQGIFGKSPFKLAEWQNPRRSLRR